MYCIKCGTQNPDDASFCFKCGNNLSSIKPEVERKGITGKLGKMGIPGFRSGKKWKMAIAIFGYFWIFLILLALVFPSPKPSPTQQKLAQTQISIEETKSKALNISYDDLMRNNENYIGKIVYYRGRILQVNEISNGKYALRVATKKESYGGYLEEVIWVNYKGSRLLENDLIDIWGEVKGLKSYTAVLGNGITIPEIESLHVELVTKSGEK
ncbi:zinc-ribbon domain protein [uncultured archaeon]|nr:zinc-ribbon domain protein [uncultured archaeon]